MAIQSISVKDLKKILANANDNDKIEVSNGELVLVPNNPTEYEFNFDDFDLIYLQCPEYICTIKRID